MAQSGEFSVKRLAVGDITLMRGINILFAAAFEAPDHYPNGEPDDAYLNRQLVDPNIVAIAGLAAGRVIGGLTGYILPKLERARSELYIYDLATAPDWRRRGIATALIEATKPIARTRGASVIFVQADYGDDPAVALYTKFGSRENVMHFNIDV